MSDADVTDLVGLLRARALKERSTARGGLRLVLTIVMLGLGAILVLPMLLNYWAVSSLINNAQIVGEAQHADEQAGASTSTPMVPIAPEESQATSMSADFNDILLRLVCVALLFVVVRMYARVHANGVYLAAHYDAVADALWLDQSGAALAVSAVQPFLPNLEPAEMTATTTASLSAPFIRPKNTAD